MNCKKVLGALAILLLLAGCAIGQKIDVRNGGADISYQGDGPIAVAAHDERAYILNKNKKPEFVGLLRGGYGNPFDVTTASGEPLSSDLANVLVDALNRAGYSAQPVFVPYSVNNAQARAKIVLVGTQRALLLTVKELKTDTYINTGFMYDLVLEVIDAAGRTIASASAAGKDNLGGSFFNPPAVAKSETPNAAAKKMSELLDQPTIRAALSE